MSEMGFITKSILSVAGTAAIYIVAFKNPALLRELAKNPSMLTKELDLLYVGTRSTNRVFQTERKEGSHSRTTPQRQAGPGPQTAAPTMMTHNPGQSLNQEA